LEDEMKIAALEQIRELQKERDELRARCERAEASCAEMRELLKHAIPSMEVAPHLYQETMWHNAKVHALSTSCGTGYISPEKAQRLRSALEMSKDAIIKLNNGCYPLEYCSEETRYRWETMKAIEQALAETESEMGK
jgi:hypothetical protein